MVDTVIRAFESIETEFDSNGLGTLPDAASCIVVEERNGEYELEMEYPVNGRHYEFLQMRRIIVAKPNPYDKPQPFRIYAKSTPINGVVTINAAHISYDLSGYPVSPFSANGVIPALNGLLYNCPIPCPFSFNTDRFSNGNYILKTPSSIRSQLGGTDGSILDVYGGEYEFDRMNVILHLHRGMDRGVSIRYGKNLIDFTQEENNSNVYTGLYPYWYSSSDEYEDQTLVTLPEYIVKAEGNYNYQRILPIDFSSDFEDEPSVTELRNRALKYMKANNIGVPEVNITVSFLQLLSSQEYETYALLETVKLCDTVTVDFNEIGVKTTAECIKTTYDVITGKYTEIELGSASSNLAESISIQEKALSEVVTINVIDRAISKATDRISGGAGGYVVIRSSTNGVNPDEILVMDTPSIETSMRVWRWNKNGLGFSQNGYNGPYEVAMTIDGEIVADFITAGILSSDRLQVGSIGKQLLTTDISDFITNGTLWLDFDPSSDGLVIGKNDSPFKVRITNEAIEFVEGNAVIASVTNQKITITNGQFTNALYIGKQESSSFAFVPRSNGSLDFKFTGYTS